MPDHEPDHADYTDADKLIADTGTWEKHDHTDKRLLFTLHGREGSRRYALIRTDRDWLLHLTKDQPQDQPEKPDYCLRCKSTQ